jgi:hypothetical protein
MNTRGKIFAGLSAVIAFVLVAGYATDAAAQNTSTTPKSTDLPTSGYAVELDGVAVLEVRSGFKTLSAEERAQGYR